MRYRVSFEADTHKEIMKDWLDYLGYNIELKIEEIPKEKEPTSTYTLVLGDGVEQVREWNKDYFEQWRV